MPLRLPSREAGRSRALQYRFRRFAFRASIWLQRLLAITGQQQRLQRSANGRLGHTVLRFEAFEARAVLAAVTWGFEGNSWSDTNNQIAFSRITNQGSDALATAHSEFGTTITPYSGNSFAYLQVDAANKSQSYSTNTFNVRTGDTFEAFGWLKKEFATVSGSASLVLINQSNSQAIEVWSQNTSDAVGGWNMDGGPATATFTGTAKLILTVTTTSTSAPGRLTAAFDAIQWSHNSSPVPWNANVYVDEDMSGAPKAGDFFIIDADNDPIQSLTVTSLTLGTGDSLTFDGNVVTAGSTVPFNMLHKWIYTPATNKSGFDRTTLQFVANDARPGDSTATLRFHVNSINDAPTATNLTAAEAYTAGIDRDLVNIVVDDVDTDILIVTLQLSNPSAGTLSTGTSNGVSSTFDPDTGIWYASGAFTGLNALLEDVKYQPAPGFYDDFTLEVKVTDNIATTTGTKLFTGNPGNQPPVLSSIENKNVNESSLLSFTAHATDPNTTQSLTYSLDTASLARGMTIGATNGQFAWTPDEEQGGGSFPVTISVIDDGTPALSDTITIQIAVGEVNSSPILQSISQKSIAEHSLLSFAAVALDEDLPKQNLSYSLDQSSVDAGMTVDSQGVFRWTPGETNGGSSYSVTLTVADNGTPVLSHSQSLSIVVNEVNEVPSLPTIGNKTVAEHSLLSFNVGASDSDLPAQTISYSLDQSSVDAGMTIDSQGIFRWTPNASQGGANYPVTLTVTDSGSPSKSSSQAFSIMVTEVNQSPTLQLPTEIQTDEGVSFQYQVVASDSDMPAQSLEYSIGGVDSELFSIDTDSGLLKLNHIPDFENPIDQGHNNSFELAITVSDGQLNVTRNLSVATHDVNEAPIVVGSVSNLTRSENSADETINIGSLFHDVDAGDLLTISGSSDNPNLVGASVSGSNLKLQFAAHRNGSAQISLSAIDSAQHSVSTTFLITVTNSIPTVTVSGPQDGYQGVVGQTRKLRLTPQDNTDNLGMPLKLEVNWGDGSPVDTLYSNQAILAEHAYSTAGVKQFTVRVTDPQGSSSTTTGSLNVLQSELQGSDWVFSGTPGDDTVTITPASIGGLSVTINSMTAVLVPSTLRGATFFLGQGADTITVNGSGQNDKMQMGGNTVTWGLLTNSAAPMIITTQDTEAIRVMSQGGNDQIEFWTGAPSGPQLTLDSGSGFDSLTATSGSTSNFWDIDGLNQGQLRLGSSSAPVAMSFTNTENLLSNSSASDLFRLGASGRLNGLINAGLGIDTLDLAALSSTAMVNLQTLAATNVVSGWSGIDNFIGNGGTLTGRNQHAQWTINSLNSGYVSYGSETTSFSGFRSLTGGEGNDKFTLTSAGQIQGTVAGGAGTDAIELNSLVAASINLATGSASNVGRFSSIERYVGDGSGSVSAPDLDNVWTITGLNTGTVVNSGGLTEFTGFGRLVGGRLSDIFSFTDAGRLSWGLNGFSGVNSLTFNGRTSAVTVNVSGVGPSAVMGGSETIIPTFSQVANFAGSASTDDTLVGPNATTEWVVSNMNAGTVGSAGFNGFERLTGGISTDIFTVQPSGSVSFIQGANGVDTLQAISGSNVWSIDGVAAGRLNAIPYAFIENLTGGTGNDTFELEAAGRIAGILNDQGGINVLSYAEREYGVYVNLTTLSATGVGIIRDVFDIVVGSSGNDNLIGSATRAMVLSGNAGNDTLIGSNTKRNVLIGGTGIDRLTAGSGEDVLIGDAYVNETDANSLRSLWTIWADPTLNRSSRISTLRNLLNSNTILDDSAVDTILGADGLDWLGD